MMKWDKIDLNQCICANRSKISCRFKAGNAIFVFAWCTFSIAIRISSSF